MCKYQEHIYDGSLKGEKRTSLPSERKAKSRYMLLLAMCLCVFKYIQWHTHTYSYTHIHIHIYTHKYTQVDRRSYYEKIGSMMFGVALPGLGYDCFRTWELLTMGTIVVIMKTCEDEQCIFHTHTHNTHTLNIIYTQVIERGVGLDRTLWRLPALLLDDFNDITPGSCFVLFCLFAFV